MQKAKPGYVERVRMLFRKHPVAKILRHLPALAEIVVRAGSGDSSGAAISALRALGIGRSSTERRNAASADDGQIAAVLDANELFRERVQTLERANEKLRSEVLGLTDQVSALNREMKNLENEVVFLRTRSAYIGWGLVAVFLLACSGIALKFLR